MNFGELKASIEGIIGRAPNAVCYQLVTADINQGARLRGMEGRAIIPEAARFSLPARFSGMISIYRDTDPRTVIEPLSPGAMQRGFRPSGVPQFYSIVDGEMLLSPAPNGSENLVLEYWADLPDLALDADTNGVLTRYPQVYVYGALAHHAALIRDNDSAQLWAAAYLKFRQQAEADTNNYFMGAIPSRPVPSAVA